MSAVLCALALCLLAASPDGGAAFVVRNPQGLTATRSPTATEGAQPTVDANLAADVRNRLERAGYTFAISYTSDVSRIRAEDGNSRTLARGLLDSSVTIDLEKAAGLRGASAFIQHLWRKGPNGSALLGDAQGFSNIDADSFQDVGELWFEQRVADGGIRFKIGRVDANTEFAGVEAAADFLNSSMGFSPTISHLPTYPNPAPALNVFATPHHRFTLAAGLYGASEGTTRWSLPFTIAELGSSWTIGSAQHAGRVRFGGWRQRHDDDGNADKGSYAVVEQTLWRFASEPQRSVTAFVQWGLAPGERCTVDRHLGGGVMWRGFTHARSADAIGVGLTRVRFGPRGERPGAHELAVVMFARIQMTQWLALTPDLQLVRHPAGRTAAGTTAAATMRISLGL